MNDRQALEKIASLIAQRGFKRDSDWDDTILDCIRRLLDERGILIDRDVF